MGNEKADVADLGDTAEVGRGGGSWMTTCVHMGSYSLELVPSGGKGTLQRELGILRRGSLLCWGRRATGWGAELRGGGAELRLQVLLQEGN